jgi:AraC-like DNA-binding protein
LDAANRDKRREATATIRNIAAIPVVLRELGADVDALLRLVGLAPLIFSNSGNVIPYAALGRLLAEGVRATGCESLGLRVGARTTASAIGLTGLVSLNSPNVRAALQVINDTLKTSETGGATFLNTCGDEASFGYTVTAPNVEAVDQIEDGSVAIAYNIMRQLCGATWRADRIRLGRRPPRDKTPFLRFFEAPVEFADSCSCFVFDTRILDQPVRDRKPDYIDVLAPLLEKAAAGVSADFLATVKLVIRSHIGMGTISRDNVCRALGISARTLSNRLDSYGASYSSLVDEARFETAQSLLMKGAAIAEIAAQLGFAEQSAFTRAFKVWSGCAPARWRATQRDQATPVRRPALQPDDR